MKRTIHTTQEDIRTENSDSTVVAVNENGKKIEENTKAIKELHNTAKDKSETIIGFTGVKRSLDKTIKAIDDLKDYIDHPEKVVSKLEEIKSATLATNIALKKIEKKEIPVYKDDEILKEMKKEKVQKVSIETGNASEWAKNLWSMLRGEKGNDGAKGEKGKDGIDGKDAKGKNGKDGSKGLDGKVGEKGARGDDGKDGSPDTPDEVVDKVNSAKKKILWKQIKGVPDFTTSDTMNQIGYASGGANQVRFLSNGVVVSAHVTEINFSTNITPTYDGNGRITLTASGSGGSTTYSETPSGTVNSVNVTFTTAHAITTVINFAINGQFIHPAEYSVVGSTITFIAAPDISLSGLPLTIIYQ